MSVLYSKTGLKVYSASPRQENSEKCKRTGTGRRKPEWNGHLRDSKEFKLSQKEALKKKSEIRSKHNILYFKPAHPGRRIRRRGSNRHSAGSEEDGNCVEDDDGKESKEILEPSSVQLSVGEQVMDERARVKERISELDRRLFRDEGLSYIDEVDVSHDMVAEQGSRDGDSQRPTEAEARKAVKPTTQAAGTAEAAEGMFELQQILLKVLEITTQLSTRLDEAEARLSEEISKGQQLEAVVTSLQKDLSIAVAAAAATTTTTTTATTTGMTQPPTPPPQKPPPPLSHRSRTPERAPHAVDVTPVPIYDANDAWGTTLKTADKFGGGSGEGGRTVYATKRKEDLPSPSPMPAKAPVHPLIAKRHNPVVGLGEWYTQMLTRPDPAAC